MGQVMMRCLKGCHFLLKDWDLNLLWGGHKNLFVGFRSRFFGMGGRNWWKIRGTRDDRCYWDGLW